MASGQEKTISADKIRIENKELRDSLERKDRELRVEAALERIRSRSMFMKHSDEITSVSEIFHKQLLELGIPSEFSYVWLPDEANQTHQFWASWSEQKGADEVFQSKQVTYPLDKSEPYTAACFAAWSTPEILLEEFIPPADVKSFFDVWEELLTGAEQLKAENFPDGIYYTEAYMNYGCFGINIRRKLSIEEKKVLKRFSIEFERAYTRFLDLLKAEEQAREAKIETALEKVRSRTMAMQSSDELPEVANIMFLEVQSLGIPAWSCGYCILLEDGKSSTCIMSSEGTLQKPFLLPHHGEKSFKEWDVFIQSDNEFFTQELKDEAIISHYDFMKSLPQLGPVFQELQDAGLSLPDYQINHLCKFNQGFLLFITYERVPDAHNTFRRFTEVFNQTYTRFLDLQKAEDQAREARIEAALEKVRSRSLAMHQSSELAEVIQVVYDQLLDLNIHVDHAGFILDYKERDDMHIWLADHQQGVPSEITIPYFDSPHWNSFLEAKSKGKNFFANLLDFEEKNQFYQRLIPLIPPMPEEAVQTIYEKPGLVISTILLENVGLYIENYSTAPFTEEENKTLMRFGKVFQQTYTRFLDLKIAEAQARESQIQAALERVRARSMGMQKSNELIGVVREIGKGIHELGIQIHYSQIFTDYTYDPKTGINIWVDVAGLNYLEKFHIPYVDHLITQRFYNPLNEGLNFFGNQFSKSEKDSYFKLLFERSDLSRIPEKRKELILKAPGWTRFTVILADSSLNFGRYNLEKFTEEEKEVFQRFGKVFGQAYTRFLDLQKAEAQAREAKIETALEKVRSRTMGMQKSEELADVAFVLFEQLRTLGGNLWGTGFGLCEKDSKQDSFWFANKNGVFPAVSIPNTTDPAHQKMYKGWKAGKDYLAIDASGKDLESHYNYMLSLAEVKPFFQKILDEGLSFPEWQQWNAAYFKQGYLLIITLEPYPDPDILKRFANVFDQTYTRFLDLQKAEAQAREAKIETALEKVRSRTMGMQKSDELAEVAVELFEQISLLTSIPSRFNVAIVNESDRVFDVWLTDVKGHILKELFVMDVEKSEVIAELFNAWKNNKKYLIQHLTGEHLDKWVEYAHEDVGIPFDKSAIQADRYINSILFKQGFIGITTDQIPDDSVLEILERFTHVFEQTYTRFLDLKNSEAQAREAKIETALEKVRSRTMGMQKSDELADVADVLFQEMNNLVQNLWTCGFVLCEKDRTEDEWWLGLEDGFTRGFFLPNVNDYAHSHLYEGWLKGEAFRTVQLEGDDLQKHYDWLMQIPVAKNIFDEMEAAGMERPEGQKLHAAYFSKGYLVIITREPCAEESIFKRFAQVFDLTYTRFLDLQKAEAQAREAQIELSLERIRAQVTAMQESSDLLDIVVTMRREFVNLGHEAHYFWHMRWLPEIYEKAMTSGDGTKIGMVMTLPRHIHGNIPPVANWEKGNDPIYVLAMETEMAVDYVDKMITLGDFEQVDPQAPTLDDIRHIGGITFVMARTTHGEIGFSLPGKVPKPSPEAVETLVRFARVFDLAYKRFEDLKAAEKDLLEIKAARERAEAALTELRATQSQLVQQEKLASLGQLTAGIAHEIKNPLNFVNNFSEVSVEMIDEALEEIEKLDDSDVKEEIIEILNDVKGNLTKVHSHGSRADSIVKSMLQHSRGGTGKMEPTDLNALIKEYVNLAFHGMRAGKNPIDVDIQFDLDEKIGKVNLIGEDFSRVILNLCNNAFDACAERSRSAMREKTKTATDYLPILSVKTRLGANSQLLIAISDNGPGIPNEIKDKILQPFFTTKKGTDGTGLGLSITNDIVKAHGGEIMVESLTAHQAGTTFIVTLPFKINQ